MSTRNSFHIADITVLFILFIFDLNALAYFFLTFLKTHIEMIYLKKIFVLAWSHKPVILALRSLRQDVCEFKASLGNIMQP
jgi:hypothetical protein